MSDCSVDKCDRPKVTRGWCAMHYQRVRKTGVAGEAETRLKPGLRPCVVDSCDRLVLSRDMCPRHYYRTRKYGNPHTVAWDRAANGSGTLDQNGYRVMVMDGRRELEHRLVMEGVLGRRLRKGESVHHKNGRRADNDPDNLELWVSPQPYGQRAADLAAWVIDNYPELVRAAMLAAA